MEDRATKTHISVIIPCYRSADYLEETVSEIKEAIANAPLPASGIQSDGMTSASVRPYRYQIILVNDGSPDSTWEVISKLCAKDRHIVGIDLAANAGQSQAKQAAVSFIRGDYAVFMDDDGQHPADQIFPMIDILEQGYHMVYAQFPEAKESVIRRLLSALSNIPTSILMRKPFRLKITSFFVLDRTAIRVLKTSPPAPFIGGTIFRRAGHVTGFSVDHRMRKIGSSNYNFKRLVKFWIELTRAILCSEATEQKWRIAKVLNPPPA